MQNIKKARCEMLPKTIIVFANYELKAVSKTQDEIDKLIGKRKVIFRGGTGQAKLHICSCVKNETMDELTAILFNHLSK